MSIATVYEKSKRYALICKDVLVVIPSRIPRDGIIIVLFIVVALAGFGLGFLAGEKNTTFEKSIQITSQSITGTTAKVQSEKNSGEGASIFSNQATKLLTHPITKDNQNKMIVASKNGGRYYLISCSGAKRIHKENQVWFVSATAARAKGYTPAEHCLGI